ncbi:Type 1 glutamine amidotransferase-like domain-containing protein [Halobacillus salinus]|uniref:Peptidase E n=1 Tax=Halobacillus salinus TaxID=192814 RepID=A0A4Z0H355_9BACI|nr:Type 1 glutamine amidotransferase-like domain-containing protein [Halobacillus salinus]TGB03605.1 hypothetical protein E4663_00945 [Halobacillus salinus]
MGNLILSGGGNAEVYEFLMKFIDKDKPILYIPLAGNEEYRPFQESLAYIKSIFLPLGVKEVTMWTDLHHRTLGDLERFSAVYFSGGSTLTLLRIIKETNFDKVLRQYFHGGGTIFGQSAGAIIFGSDVTHTTTEEEVSRYEPLNLVHNNRLWCHYDVHDEGLLRKYSKGEGDPFLALPDGGAVHVTERQCEVIRKVAYEFKDGRRKELIPDGYF